MRASLTVLLVLGVAGVGLGFHRDWLHPGGNQGSPPQNPDGAYEGSQGLGGQVEDRVLGHRARTETGAKAFGIATAIGWIKKIEAADYRFSITTVDNEKLTVHLSPSTTLRLNGRDITLEDLQGEDQVRVEYALMNGKIVATAITVDRR